ncbi:MAG: hypothetical protein HDS48_02005 [Bacteroides sp.]|nr:hypothetical protein [Bacteroides sp.]MDE6078186.1 hypothetical protein [Muribaculaceae bacterium]MDE6423423.1 hypothetical protein [Muribaculaceae bacterium]
MNQILKQLENDTDGMLTYEYIANNFENCEELMSELVDNLIRVDHSGQFLASSARYLAAVDRDKFSPWLPSLIEAAIAKDRERRYIGSLLESIWGSDYRERAEELRASDDNFRRIYKRIYPGEAASSLQHQI